MMVNIVIVVVFGSFAVGDDPALVIVFGFQPRMTAGVGDGFEQVVVRFVGAFEFAVAVAFDRFAQRIDDGDEVVMLVVAVLPASSAVVFQPLDAILDVVVQINGGAAAAVDAGQAVVGAMRQPQGVAVAVFQPNQVAVLVGLAWAVVVVVENEGVGILAECFGGKTATATP